MENSEIEKTVTADEGSQLNRNRSFKSKQLVRSQAIRESTSPPRTISPSVRSDDSNGRVNVTPSNRADTGPASDSSHDSDVFSYDDNKCGVGGKQRVEIQITSGSWSGTEPEQSWSSRRSRRWPGRDLLSNNPRVACVCGACAACPQCRGRRRRHKCPTKQDSGIVCSEDCPDCSDTEQNSSTNDIKKSASGSIETDEQYCRCSDRKEKPKNISLSRTDSDERSEPLGPELVAFIKETLNKNARDRTTLLRIERELHAFINDPGRCIVKFPVMTSYGRMLVHRCAALFQLAHHLDQSNKTCVIVSKSGTCGGRIPCTSFKSWCVASLPPSPARHGQDQHHAKSILKRDTHSLDEPSSGPSGMSRSKSLEQREREYERVRRRIFSEDDPQWPWLNAGAPVKLLTPEPGRNKLLKVQSLENPSGPPPGSWRGAGAVSKSHSFGGYGDQQPRALSRQGDLASSSWRLSPSSSGYKTLSLRSTDSVTPSPTGGGTPEPAGAAGAGGALVWAVTDLAAVPRGVILIHPQTGRPLTNPDGTVYHFDPANPPLMYDPAVHDPQQEQIDQNNEKRRGRLEKQDSFMDNDTECHQSEECRNKSCCEYRKQEQQLQQQQLQQQQLQQQQLQQQQSQQHQSQQHCQQHLQQTESPVQHVDTTIEKETSKPPPSPIKTYANPIQNHTAEPTNHSKVADAATNHRTPDTHQPEPANQRYESQALTNRNYELANQREVAKMMSQDMVHYNTAYAQAYNQEEMTSPPQMNPYIQQDMTHIPMGVPQSKVAPLHDPNMRQVPLTNMMYQAGMPQAYSTYIPNHRMEPIPQQMYQPMMQQMEEPKQISSPQQDTTFRIDPSYPFPAVDYACCDATQLRHHPPPQRSYSVPFGAAEPAQALLPPAYPAPLLLPPVTHYPVQYQEAVQWAPVPSPAPKLFDVCPVVYQPPYTAYTVPYTQMLPQPYPMYQPVQVEKPDPQPYRKRNSLPPTARTTPLTHTPDEKKQEEKEINRQESAEIAAKIQQIKEAMNGSRPRGAETRRGGGGAETRRDGAWRRNSGHGILGTCPAQYQAQGHPDESQLSTAARAIINSLRNMQVNNTYQPERRPHESQGYHRSYERSEGYRHRRDRDGDKPGDRRGNQQMERQEVNGAGGVGGRGDGDRRPEARGPRAGPHPLSQPVYRAPYLLRQMSPGTWCRRSPAPVHPNMNQPRRPHPDTRPRR